MSLTWELAPVVGNLAVSTTQVTMKSAIPVAAQAQYNLKLSKIHIIWSKQPNSYTIEAHDSAFHLWHEHCI